MVAPHENSIFSRLLSRQLFNFNFDFSIEAIVYQKIAKVSNQPERDP